MSEQPHRKITPQHPESDATPFVIGGILISVLLIGIALVVAATRDSTDPPLPTVVPAPVLADGTALTEDAVLYVAESIPFSVLAADNQESDDILAEPCIALNIQRSPIGTSDYFYLDATTNQYWVFAVREDQQGNGWLPFDVLQAEPSTECD